MAVFIFIFVNNSAIAAEFVIDASKNAVWHNERGLFFLRFGNYYGAVEEFRIAISLNPDSEASAAFYNNLGSAYYKLGMYKPAALSFKNAVSLNQNFLHYHQNLVDSYKGLNVLDKEIKKQEKILVKNPYNSRAALMLGLMQLKNNNRKKAVEYLSEFKRLEPDLDLSRQIDLLLKELR